MSLDTIEHIDQLIDTKTKEKEELKIKIFLLQQDLSLVELTLANAQERKAFMRPPKKVRTTNEEPKKEEKKLKIRGRFQECIKQIREVFYNTQKEIALLEREPLSMTRNEHGTWDVSKEDRTKYDIAGYYKIDSPTPQFYVRICNNLITDSVLNPEEPVDEYGKIDARFSDPRDVTNVYRKVRLFVLTN